MSKVLLACEESQAVTKEFRKLGIEAYSCDLQPCSGGHPEWHIEDYAEDVVRLNNWDLIIAFPPCTYLSASGNRWFNEDKYGVEALDRYDSRIRAIIFFMMFATLRNQKVAIENPIGIMSSVYRKPDQIIQPYQFGDPAEKRTCLWLRGLPPLEPTNIVEPPPRQKVKGNKSLPEWYSNAPKKDRGKIRSKTFPGIAKAMAEQWSEVLT